MRYYIGFFYFIAVLIIPFPAFVYAVEPDIYEEDNSPAQAKVIILNDAEYRKHNFHEPGDEDWIKFYGLEGESYSIQADNVGADCDVVIRLYDTDRVTFLEKGDDAGAGGADSLQCSPLIRDGIYYVKISDSSELSGNDTGYDLSLNRPKAAVVAMFQGSATDSISKAPLGNVMIKTDDKVTALSEENNGGYLMYHQIGSYTLTAKLPGYEIFTKPVFTVKTETETYFETETVSGGTRSERERVRWDGIIELIPRGDITGDHKIDLADVISGLQVLTGTGKVRADYIKSGADVSGDNKVGMEEVFHILNILQNQET